MNTTNLMSIDEDARRQFEAAWRNGRPERIEQFLPAPDSSRFAATLEELVLIDLEMAWRRFAKASTTTESPRLPLVEQYLMRFECLRQPEVTMRLLRHEFQVRHFFGDRPAADEYKARFPHLVLNGQEVETLVKVVETPALPPPVIPGYEILGELGHGGMGMVYKARQSSLKRIVALKMILNARAGEEELARFRIEAEAVAQLQHPNIAQIYEVGEHEGRPYCALEYLDGGSLDKQIAGTPQPVRAAAHLVEQIARAAHSAHERGIIHRDLKPANVLLTAAGLPKITDFGLAKRLEGDSARTRSGAILGTPSYMAPEQAASSKVPIGPAADVYGLGAVLYELLTGRPPFRAESWFSTVQQVLYDEALPPTRLRSKVPRDLETICLTCLRKEPHRRYASAAALADDLGRFLRGEPIVARPVGWTEKAVKWAKRRPASAGLVGTAILLAAGALMGLFIWQHMEQERLQTEHEHEQERLREETRHGVYVSALRSGAAADETFALKEIRAGRFAEAEQILRRATRALKVEPLLAEQRKSLQGKRDRAKLLADFYRLMDRSEWLGFLDADSEALAASQVCLQSIGIPEHGLDWPAHLPAAELESVQREKLEKDVNAAMMMLVALRVKQALVMTLKGNTREEDRVRARANFTAALDQLKLIKDARRWQMGRLAEFLCRHYLKLDNPKTTEMPKDEPLNGYDYYGIGMVHLWIASRAETGTKPGAKLDPLTQAFVKTALGGFNGLDLSTPRTTGYAMLHKAAELEPQHYWSHFWLGWSYLAAHPPESHAAEMAFTRCVEVRPSYGFGFAERGRTRFLLRGETANAALQAELQRRGLEDIRQALRLNPQDPYIHWVNAQIQAALGEHAQVLVECALAVELEAPLRALDGRVLERNSSLAEQINNSLAFWTKENPKNASAFAVRGHASWVCDQDDAALEAAANALDVEPRQPRALAVRGAVWLRRGQPKEALAQFESALVQAPNLHLALAGRARAQEILGLSQDALAGYTSILSDAARPDWQRLEALLGRSRMLKALGRDAEVDAVLAEAEELSPGIIKSR